MFCADAGSGDYFMLWLSGTGVNKGSFIKVKIILVNVITQHTVHTASILH